MFSSRPGIHCISVACFSLIALPVTLSVCVVVNRLRQALQERDITEMSDSATPSLVTNLDVRLGSQNKLRKPADRKARTGTPRKHGKCRH
eukprot:6229450-Amphidinium_carterae.1